MRIFLWLLPILIKWATQNPVHMSDRNRRPSTIKATQSQVERTEARKVLSRAKKHSSTLKKLIEEEETELNSSVVDLFTLSSDSPGEGAEPSGLYLETSNFDTAGATANPSARVPENLNLEDSDCGHSDDSGHYLDPLKAVKSPTKEVTSEGSARQEEHPVFENPESPSFGNIDSPDSLLERPVQRISPDWSTQNQFFPPGCLLTPQLVPRPERGASVGSFLLPSPAC